MGVFLQACRLGQPQLEYVKRGNSDHWSLRHRCVKRCIDSRSIISKSEAKSEEVKIKSESRNKLDKMEIQLRGRSHIARENWRNVESFNETSRVAILPPVADCTEL